ncbi:MAG: hypothetical protein RI953_2182, partial [Pseudomonadota bacterium]
MAYHCGTSSITGEGEANGKKPCSKLQEQSYSAEPGGIPCRCRSRTCGGHAFP